MILGNLACDGGSVEPTEHYDGVLFCKQRNVSQRYPTAYALARDADYSASVGFFPKGKTYAKNRRQVLEVSQDRG